MRWRPSFSVGRAVRTRYVMRELRSLGPSVRTVMDAGCGDGFVSERMARKFPSWEITALEPDPVVAGSAEARLRGRPAVKVITGGVGDEPPHGSAYDLVVCMDVLEHIRDDRSAVQWLAARVGPGGRLVIHVPARGQQHWSTEVAEAMEREIDSGTGPHFREGYEPHELRALLEEQGLVVERSGWTFHQPLLRFAVDLDQLLHLRRWRIPKLVLLPGLALLAQLERRPSTTERGHGVLLVARRGDRKA